MSDPILVVGPRRRGRPALSTSGASAPVCIKLPPADYDKLFTFSRRSRESVPDVIRRAVKKLIADERGGSI